MPSVNSLHLLDSRNLDELLFHKSVQTIITSPPYLDRKNYTKSALQIGWGQTNEEYYSEIENVFKKCYNITKTNGTLWLVIDTHKSHGRLQLLPLEIMKILEGVGWIPQDIIIWDKVKNLPYSRKGQFRNNFEYILLFSKSDRYKYYIDRIRDVDSLKEWWIKYPERYNPLGKVPENIWSIPIPTQGSWGNGSIKHLCPFPVDLVEKMILLSTNKNDLVFDPFAGSGAVLATAKCLGRQFIGCDVNAKYIERFKTKVLPDIENQFISKNKRNVRRKLKQKKLRRFIISLRKLKFAKVLLQKVHKEFGDGRIKHIVVKSSNRPTDRNVYIKIVIQDRKYLKNTKKFICDISTRNPLSKYGLVPRVQFSTRDNYRKYFNHDEIYYFYLGGKFFDLNKTTTVEAFEASDKRKYPPIISNLRISLKSIHKTFKPT